MSTRMTCLYRYNAELLKARSLKAVLVSELCQTAYERLEAASSFTRREQQSMRMFTAHLQSCIKRVTSECDYQSRIVWPREGTNSLFVEDHALISRQCRRLLQGELKRTLWCADCVRQHTNCWTGLPHYRVDSNGLFTDSRST